MKKAVLVFFFLFTVCSSPLSTAQTSDSVWDGVYTLEQAQRGEADYFTYCSPCHGAGLEGGEMAPGLLQGQFIWTWDGYSVGDIFTRIRSTMPLNAADTVSRQKKADILAYLMFKNEFPPGEFELSTRVSYLNFIIWNALRPE